MPDTPLNPEAVSSIADVIFRHCGGYVDTTRADAERAAKAVLRSLAAAQPVVNSVEELDQLPIGSLIMMSGVVAPFLHTDDGWESTRTPGKPVWDYTANPSYLPARVLYRPTEESTNGR